MGIGIKCGDYSYAQVPFAFDHIIGVSGTLKILSPSEKKVLNDDYQIKKASYIPSVFGNSNLKFSFIKDVHVESDA